MAEEHDKLQNVEVHSNFDVEGNDEKNDGDDYFLWQMDFSGFENKQIPLNPNLDHEDLGPISTFFENFFFNDNEVAQTAT